MVRRVRRLPRRPRRKVIRRPRKVMRKRIMKRKEDYARLVEGAENQLMLDATGNYSFNYTTSLSEFQRAQEVAHSYKYYRAAKVELTFIPYANVAALGVAAGQRLPQLYFTVDRVANQWIQPTEAEMIERGVSPRLFKKKMVFSWKPSLLQSVQLEVNQPSDGTGKGLGIDVIGATNSIPLFNKWLPTQQSYGYTPPAGPNAQLNQTVAQPSINPYALRYYGASFVIDQEGGVSGAVGDLITKVTWEFKGPRALKTNAPTPQIVVSPETSMTTIGVVANTQPTDYGGH